MAFKTYLNAGAGAGGGGMAPVTSPVRRRRRIAGGWHPDVLYMLALVVAEIVARRVDLQAPVRRASCVTSTSSSRCCSPTCCQLRPVAGPDEPASARARRRAS